MRAEEGGLTPESLTYCAWPGWFANFPTHITTSIAGGFCFVLSHGTDNLNTVCVDFQVVDHTSSGTVSTITKCPVHAEMKIR